jgi:hypothetical protein
LRLLGVLLGLVVLIAAVLSFPEPGGHEKGLAERRALHARQGLQPPVDDEGRPLSPDEQLQGLQASIHDPDPDVRRQVGAGLEAMCDPRADAVLERAIDEENLPVVAGGYLYVTTWRKQSWPPRRRINVLARAVEQYADISIARELINDRDSTISGSAVEWANAHGYAVLPK